MTWEQQRDARRELSRLWSNRAKHMNDRARKFQATGYLSPADLREIVRRDGSRCIYCNKQLDYETRGNGHSDSATFDHLIRLCDGGSHTYENVGCACHGCNQRNAAAAHADPEGEALKRLRLFLARKPGSVAA